MLRHLLENAKIGKPDAAEGQVAQGQVVTVRFPAFDDTETFLLGSREEAATASIDVYSPTSPLGSAVLGRLVGETVEYETPAGKTHAGRDRLRRALHRLIADRRPQPGPGTVECRASPGRCGGRADGERGEDRDDHDGTR